MKTLLSLAGLLLATGITGQDISLVEDLNTTPSYYEPDNLFSFMDKLYICIDNGTYVYDGKTSQRFAFYNNPSYRCEYNQKLYFSDYDAGYEGRLWEYNGLDAPVEIAHFDLAPYARPFNLTVFRDKLYFALDDGVHGMELWVYDFVNPPSLAADIYPGSDASGPSGFIAFRDKLYLIAAYRELWGYDGTNPPEKVTDLGWGLDHTIAVVNDKLCLALADSVFGRELWEYDGMNPPVLVSDILPGSGSSDPKCLYELNQVLYFTATDSTHGKRFWKYDGKGVLVPADDLNENINGAVEGILKKINDKLYVTSSNRDTAGYETLLWVYDGLNPPVQVIALMEIGLYMLAEAGGILYFVTHKSHSSTTAWEWDGINPPMVSSLGSTSSSHPNCLIPFNNKLYFLADDGIHGFNVWGTDGTNPPVMLAGAGLPTLYGNESLMVMNRNLYLLTDSNVWVTDGVHPLTSLGNIGFYFEPFVFKDKLYYESYRNDKFELDFFDGINPPAFLANTPEYVSGSRTEFNGKLYFSAWDSAHGTELFATNGNDPAGLVADIYPGSYGSGPNNLAVYRGKLYFGARGDPMHGYEFWSYDGVSDPVMVALMDRGPDSSFPAWLTQVDSMLYFESGGIIWVFDGMNKPEMVHGGYINPNFKPWKLTAFNHKLYFLGCDENNGYEPWVYDGIHEPKMIADQIENFWTPIEPHFAILRHTLFFTFRTNGPNEFWAIDRSDHEESVSKIDRDTRVYYLENPVAFRSRLYFSAFQYSTGEELFALSLPPDTTMAVASCGSYDFNGTWLTGSGAYFDTIPGKTGIDSIIALNLEVRTVNTDVFADGQKLQAELDGANYQWADCGESWALVPGAVEQSFVPSVTGEYAVIITDSGCVDTSACYAVQVTGLMESSFRKTISIYPNPNEGSFTIRLGRVCRDVVITILGSDGQVIRKVNAGDTGAVDLKLEAPPGIYLVRITTENEVVFFKIIKE